MARVPPRRTIVITGCSSGFGRLTALHLAQLGWHVFATVRKEADQTSLYHEAAKRSCKHNLSIVICDITQAEQVAGLEQTVAASTPRLDALLNNAGTGFPAPLELLALDDLRTQLEINVVAQLAVTQALLPLLKAARGVIINVTSVNAHISLPVTGAYSASKSTLEGLSDVLRLEVAPFGVRVVMIEPMATLTNLWETIGRRSQVIRDLHLDGPYAQLLITGETMAMRLAKMGFRPPLFVDTVLKILNSHHPRARYVVPGIASGLIFLHQVVPQKLWDWVLRRMYKW